MFERRQSSYAMRAHVFLCHAPGGDHDGLDLLTCGSVRYSKYNGCRYARQLRQRSFNFRGIHFVAADVDEPAPPPRESELARRRKPPRISREKVGPAKIGLTTLLGAIVSRGCKRAGHSNATFNSRGDRLPPLIYNCH